MAGLGVGGVLILGHLSRPGTPEKALQALFFSPGIATFLIAFVPSYDSIGIWGAIILTVLRMLQGISRELRYRCVQTVARQTFC